MIRFLVVEGPAGAGKTYLTTHLEEKYGLPVARGSLPSRKPVREDAPFLSALNDYDKALQAARMWKEEGKENILIERFVISQWVYGSLRAVHTELPDLITRRFQKQIHAFGRSLLLTALKEMMWRTYDGDDREPYGFSLMWMLLLPDEEVIEARRAKVSRPFAFSARAELDDYRLATQVMPKGAVVRVYGLEDTVITVKEWIDGEFDPTPVLKHTKP